MNAINVKIRRLHADAQIPAYATEGAAAFDLVAVEDVIIAPGETKKVPLGFAFEIPSGYVMIVAMRSGIAYKTKLRQSNGVGVIDADFRGEVAVMFDNTGTETDSDGEWHEVYNVAGEFEYYTMSPYESGSYIIRKGDRIAQGVVQPVPRVEFTETNELSETARGAGGFGSSGIGTEVDV